MRTFFGVLAAVMAGAALAAPTTTITRTVTVSTTEPWPHVCQTTVTTSTLTYTSPIRTVTTTLPTFTSTEFNYCFLQGCGPSSYPHLTPVATPTPAPAPKIQARDLVTTTWTEKYIYMSATCVEWRDQTAIVPTTITHPTVTATATAYSTTVPATAILEFCDGWNTCPGSPYLVTAKP